MHHDLNRGLYSGKIGLACHGPALSSTVTTLHSTVVIIKYPEKSDILS